MIDNLKIFEFPSDWQIHRNQFNDIDLRNENIDDFSLQQQYCQEDLLWIQKGEFNIDLGWYGGDNKIDTTSGFMLVLYRGQNWNNCELLELYRSKSISKIQIAIKEFVQFVTENLYSDLIGYKIDDESDNRYIGQHIHFSVRDHNLQQ